MTAHTRSIVAVFFLLTAVCAAAPDAAANTTLRLSIGSAEGANGETVTVPVALYGSRTASTILFRITYDPQRIEFVDVGAGSALDTDQQVLPPTLLTPNTVGITAFGSGKPIADGELCLVDFRIVTAVSGEANLGGSQPSAASTTDDSISVSITDGEVYLNCTGLGPDTPDGVTASTDDPDAVAVSWLPAAGAYEYRVYRASTNQPENVIAVSDWLPGATSFTDTTAGAPALNVAGLAGCSGANQAYQFFAYYYWVRARSEGGCPSDYSLPAEGYRAADKSATAVPPLRADAAMLAGVAALLAAGAVRPKRSSEKRAQ